MNAGAANLVVCPRDGTKLVEVERDDVMIDACPTCRGIWLDRGELEKIIAYERAVATDDDFLAEVTGRRDTDHPDDADGPDNRSVDRAGKRRRGGFFENFLDFGGE